MVEIDEKRYQHCARVPLALEPLATSLDISLSDAALHMQRLVFGIGTLFDDTLDTGTVAEQQAVLAYWKALAFNTPLETSSEGTIARPLATDLAELHTYLTPEQASSFYRLGEQTLNFTHRSRATKDPRSYHLLRTEEGRLAFEMVASTVPESEQEHPRFRRYVQLVGTAGKVAASLDGIADLWQDAKEGRTAVSPTPGSYALLSQLALSETTNGIREIGFRTILPILGKAAVIRIVR